MKSITPRIHKQSRYALTINSVKYLNGIAAGNDFPAVDDNVVTVPDPDKYRRHDLHTVDTFSSNDNRVTFRTYKFLPKKFWYNNHIFRTFDPQGLLISTNSDGSARYAYIAINATSSNSGDIKFSDIDKGNYVVQFIRINMNNDEIIASENPADFMAGPPINLEHGQTNARNTNGEIIVMGHHLGTSTVGSMCKIDRTTLGPSDYGQITFHVNPRGDGYRLGNDLCGLSNGNYLNVCPNTNGKTPLIPEQSLMLYELTFSYDNGVWIHAIPQYIQNTGGSGAIQGITENPNSRRVSILYDDSIVSFPEDKLGHLKPSDFKQVIFNAQREIEGFAYDDNGVAYMLTDRSPEILVSKDMKDF